MIIKTKERKVIKCLEPIKEHKGGYSIWGVRWIKIKKDWSKNKCYYWSEAYKPFDFDKNDIDSPF